MIQFPCYEFNWDLNSIILQYKRAVYRSTPQQGHRTPLRANTVSGASHYWRVSVRQAPGIFTKLSLKHQNTFCIRSLCLRECVQIHSISSYFLILWPCDEIGLYTQYPTIHYPCFLFYEVLRVGGWSQSQRTWGERRGTAWTGHQPNAGPTYRDNQPFTIIPAIWVSF